MTNITQKVYSKSLNLEAIARRIADVLGNDDFEVQKMGSGDDVYVQVRKGGLLHKVVGMDQALTVHMQKTGTSTSISQGQAEWMSKAASMGIGALVLWPFAVTSAVGIYSQNKLPGRIWKIIDDYAITQGAPVGVQTGEMGTPIMGTEQGMHCPHCGATNPQESKFCNACGTKLKA